MNILVFSVSASLFSSILKKSGWKLSSIPYLPRRDLPSDIEKACPGPWGAHYQVTNENETFVLWGTSQAHSRARCYRLTLKTAHPLIDWREAGWVLTLALNGLKYACATVFSLWGQMISPSLDDLSSPFRAFSSGINWLLPRVMPLMDNRLIFLDYPIYMAVA